MKDLQILQRLLNEAKDARLELDQALHAIEQEIGHDVDGLDDTVMDFADVGELLEFAEEE